MEEVVGRVGKHGNTSRMNSQMYAPKKVYGITVYIFFCEQQLINATADETKTKRKTKNKKKNKDEAINLILENDSCEFPIL